MATQQEVNPFAELGKEVSRPNRFRGSIAKALVLPSKFPTASGGIKNQLYLTIVRWPTRYNWTTETYEDAGTVSTFGKWLSGRDIDAFFKDLTKVTGRAAVEALYDGLPLHLDIEERHQSDYQDRQSKEWKPRRDKFVPISKIADVIPEEVLVACANALITREGMEVSEDTGQGGSFEGEAITGFVSAVTGMKADDVAAIAENYSDLGPDVVSYIASNQALNQLVMDGKLNINEAGVVEAVEAGKKK